MTESTRVLDVKAMDAKFVAKFGACVLVAAGEMGTLLLEAGTGAPSEGVVVHLWQEPRSNDPLRVQLAYDTKLAACWMSVYGSTEERRAALVETLDLVLPSIPVATLKKAALRWKDPNALIRLALSLGATNSPSAAAIFGKGLRSPKPAFRIAAASAMGVLKWSSFRRPLERALATETDASARRVIEAALQECRAA